MRYRVELTRTTRMGEVESTVSVALEEEYPETPPLKSTLEGRASHLLEKEVEKAREEKDAELRKLGRQPWVARDAEAAATKEAGS